MGLRQKARLDTCRILADANGFSWPIVVTDPDGRSVTVPGFAGDVADFIDPDTGQAVSGRQATCSISMDALAASSLGHPVHVSESNEKPWTCSFNDTEGIRHYFKVMESRPDRTVGLILLHLESYVP